MLGAYAELQRTVAGRAAQMVALGVPDLRPELMPGLLATLLDDPQVTTGLGAERHAALRELAPAYASWCAELTADGVPCSLQHDDLTDGNVFPVDGGFRFFDWGDASVAHPFGSLLVALSAGAYRFDLAPGDPRLTRLRDAYLEPWTAGRDRGGLLRSAALAVRVAKVGRALSWQRALAGAELPVPADQASAVVDWLAELTGPDLVEPEPIR